VGAVVAVVVLEIALTKGAGALAAGFAKLATAATKLPAALKGMKAIEKMMGMVMPVVRSTLDKLDDFISLVGRLPIPGARAMADAFKRLKGMLVRWSEDLTEAVRKKRKGKGEGGEEDETDERKTAKKAANKTYKKVKKSVGKRRPKPRLERPFPIAIPMALTALRALAVGSAELLADFRFHHRRQSRLQRLPQQPCHVATRQHVFDKRIHMPQTLLAGHPWSSCVFRFHKRIVDQRIGQFLPYTNVLGTIKDAPTHLERPGLRRRTRRRTSPTRKGKVGSPSPRGCRRFQGAHVGRPRATSSSMHPGPPTRELRAATL